jgi:hypothetical protein
MLGATSHLTPLTKPLVSFARLGVRCEVAPNIPLQIEDLYQMLGVFVKGLFQMSLLSNVSIKNSLRSIRKCHKTT